MDLAGSFVNSKGPHIPVEALNAGALDVTGASEDLYRLVGDTAAHLGREILAETDVHGHVFVAVALARCLKDQCARRLDLGLWRVDGEVVVKTLELAAATRDAAHIVRLFGEKLGDIDAGFGNEEATYLLAKQMIEAGACCIQIENQVSDEKQCGHQDFAF